MKKFTKKNIAEINIEAAHGGSGSRQILVKPGDLTGKNFEVMTKGYLNFGSSFDWHLHEGIDEIFLVLKGQGKFYWETEIVDYSVGDIFTIPANSKHKISAEGEVNSEFYFVRIKI